MLAVAASPVAIHAAGRYLAIRRGHGGHRVRGPHAPPAAPSFTMGKLPRHGARAMDETETPPNPRGVPVRTAVLSLTAPDLVAAYLAARDAPALQAELGQHAEKLRAASYEADSSHRGDWGLGGNDLREADRPGSWLYEARREKRIADQAATQARAARTKAPGAALEADFQARIRDGRIVVSCLDRSKPSEPRFDLPPERAALIGWPRLDGSLRYGGTVLEALRYRAGAAPVPLAEAPFAFAPEAEKRRYLDGWEPTPDEVAGQAEWVRLTPYLPPGAERAIEVSDVDVEAVARFNCICLGRYQLAEGWKPHLVRELRGGALQAWGFIIGDAAASIRPFPAHAWHDVPAEQAGDGQHLDWDTGRARLNGQDVILLHVQRPAAVPERAEALPPAPASPGGPVVNRGGRPPKFDRVKIANRLRDVANTPDGLPESAGEKRELVRRIATELAGEEPSDSTLAEIMKELELR